MKNDPAMLERLNDPERLQCIPPAYIWDKLENPECRVLVDIGAGTGLFSRAFLDLMGGGTIYALDESEVMVAWMNANMAPVFPDIHPALMDDAKIPLEDADADVVIMFSVHHELKDPGRMLAEVLRILKPGGKLCIADWKREKTKGGPPLAIRIAGDEIARQMMDAGFVSVFEDIGLERHSLVLGEKPKA